MKPLRIFLLAALVLVVFSSGNVEATTKNWDSNFGGIRSISITSDGGLVAIGDSSHWIHLVDNQNGTAIWSYQTYGVVNHVAISSDGNHVAAGSDDYRVYLFGKNSSTPLWHSELDERVNALDVSSDGSYIVAGAQNPDRRIYLFSKDSSVPIWNYRTNGNVVDVSISNDGQYIAAASSDYKIRVFHKDSNEPLWSYSLGSSPQRIEMSDDSNYLVVGGEDEMVHLFETVSGVLLWSYDVGNTVREVDITPDGSYIVAATYDGKRYNDKLFLFNKNNSIPLWSFQTDGAESSDEGGRVYDVEISYDGKYIAAVSNNNKAYLFDAESNVPIWSNESQGQIVYLALTPDGGDFITTCAGNLCSFRNEYVERPTIYSYYPRDGIVTDAVPTLYWYPGSDDVTNLTFDVYLDTQSSPSTIVADDILLHHYSVTGLLEGHTYYWKVVATDGTGSVTSKLMNFTVLDTTPPIANITSGPSDPSDSRNATFNFTANEDDVTFQCRMDTSDWHSCSGPKTYTNLSDDTTHQFQVKATDSFNNTGNAVSWIWKISDSRIITVTRPEVEEEDEDESGLPSISLIPALITIGIIALRRRY